MGFAATVRLLRAGYVLAREGAFSIVDIDAMPPAMRTGVRLARLFERGAVRRRGPQDNLRSALDRLGPTYVKIGQTLATRPDVVGPLVAANLAQLQDKMEPFDPALVPALLGEALGERAADLTEISAPVAAASIAQVHKATLYRNGVSGPVAVKILRPGIKERFRRDLEAQYAGAALAERWMPSLRRLRPTDVVATLDHSARLELDLRLEAASISEMAENIKDDEGFVIPQVSWDHTAETVLTTSWVEGIPIREIAALDAAGLDRKALSVTLLQSFLKHAIRDGFFHADMHPGNLFADRKTGAIIAVDFGIMGRISRKERRFLADILYGFITRNYRLIAQRHFEIGYVPRHQSVDDFALALRSIGEPLHGR
jgi:ubiquinone biosynthesis protein